MRVGTFTMYHDFTRNQEKSIKYLNDVNRQIYSGTKIEYGYQDTSTFVNTLRLDQEEYTLSQNALGADMARQFASNSDNTMNQMVKTLTEFKTKLINATSESNSTTDRRAIAQELVGLRQHMMNLANTSINGQYLFSGSAFAQKPIDASGNYQGNSDEVKSLISSGVQLPFNIDGNSLFLGSDNDYARTVSTNVPKKNITLLYDQPPTDRYITVDDKIKDMTGNNGDGEKSYFYVTGTQSDGTSFKQRIDVSADSKISDLLDKIKDTYKGNVDVTLNNYGEIEVKDLQKGSSKLQFHMVGSDNSGALTKATTGFTSGSTAMTVQSSTGIAVGDVLNIEGLGQVQVASITASATTPLSDIINYKPPLGASPKAEVTEVSIKKVNASSTTADAGAAPYLAGATSLNVASATGMAAGDEIIIGGEKYTISSTTAGPPDTINLSSGLKANVAAGDPVSIVTPLTDVGALASSGQSVTEFMKSGMAPLTVVNAPAWNDQWDHSTFNFNVEFKNRQSAANAQPQELLTSVLGGIPSGITLNGTAHAFSLTTSSTMRNLVDEIQGALDSEFGANQFSTTLVSGKIVVKDKNIDPKYTDTQSSRLRTMTLNGDTTVGVKTFASINGVESDKVYFKKDGAILSSNVSQVVSSTNAYAKPTDTLLSTSGSTTMVGKQLTMEMTNVDGNNQTVTIDFAATGATFTVGANKYSILNADSPQTITMPNDVTYRQLTDVMSMVIGNTLPSSTTVAAPGAAIGATSIDLASVSGYSVGDKITIGNGTSSYTIGAIAGTTLTLSPALTAAATTGAIVMSAKDYNSAVDAASRKATVSIDDTGKIVVEDKTHSATRANLSMYDSTAGVGTNMGYTKSSQISTNSLTLNSNNALTLDDPYVSIFDQLQAAIDSVISGKTRASDNGDDPRNTGMQNAILAIDHIFDHVVRKHTDIGAVGNSFQLSVDRSTTLKINVKTVRSEVLDTDIGSAYLELNQRSINYQALLATVNKINGLSLVNYM